MATTGIRSLAGWWIRMGNTATIQSHAFHLQVEHKFIIAIPSTNGSLMSRMVFEMVASNAIIFLLLSTVCSLGQVGGGSPDSDGRQLVKLHKPKDCRYSTRPAIISIVFAGKPLQHLRVISKLCVCWQTPPTSYSYFLASG